VGVDAGFIDCGRVERVVAKMEKVYDISYRHELLERVFPMVRRFFQFMRSIPISL
jgi:hypothetical protein